ncbi:MAG: DNA-methyltransferase [bacterium]
MIKIYNNKVEEIIHQIKNNSIDLTITSPPYNVDLGNNKNNKNSYDIYNDNKNHKDYLHWLQCIFSAIYVKTKKGGRCAINIGDGKNGKIPTHSDIIQFMSDMGWMPMANILWNKNNVSSRTAWGSFQSPSCPSFPTPFEYILVFAKENIKLQYKGETDLTKKEFIEWTYSMWNITGESKKKIGHPAPFPIEIPYRLIKMLSWKDALIFDPFLGSGTTAIASKKLNRRFIGSEMSEEYYKIIQKRLEETEI